VNVEFYRHQLGEEHAREVAKVLDTVFLTTGPVTGRFEESFAEWLGVGNVVGLTSCTAGLFLCLVARGIGPGDEVIVPAMTFVATANAVLHAGATPVFADVEPETGLLDLEDAREKLTGRTRAIIPVHLYGHMVDMVRFRAFADEHDLFLLEDAAHCVEGARDGVRPGGLGDAVCFSFYATKNLTCGEGGAVATNDPGLADALRVLRLHGLDRDAAKRYQHFKHYDMIELGYKFNMNDIQAAMLLPQLERIDAAHAVRGEVCAMYTDALDRAALPVRTVKVEEGVRHARHLFVLRVESRRRDPVLAHLQENGVGVAVNYRAVHLNSYYRRRLGTGEGLCPDAERMGGEVVSLPFYPGLKEEEIEYVVSVLSHYFEKDAS